MRVFVILMFISHITVHSVNMVVYTYYTCLQASALYTVYVGECVVSTHLMKINLSV